MDTQRIESLVPLPSRPSDGHKGTFGSVGIIGGCAGNHRDESFAATMLGAPALSAMGAIRAGCGLVQIAAPAPIIESVLTLAPFATGIGMETDSDRQIIASSAAVVIDAMALKNDAIVVGPGLGTGIAIEQIMMRLIGQEDAALIVDADALNVLSSMSDFVRDVRATMVLTPHPGEAARLMKALSIDGDPSGNEEQRVQACTQIAQRIGCVVVLKGKGTVVSDGHRVWVCDRGDPAMGAGGTGDVLAGVIGSIVTQTRTDSRIDLLMACMISVQAHAVAGERWAETHNAHGGMIASELADLLPKVIEGLR